MWIAQCRGWPPVPALPPRRLALPHSGKGLGLGRACTRTLCCKLECGTSFFSAGADPYLPDSAQTLNLRRLTFLLFIHRSFFHQSHNNEATYTPHSGSLFFPSPLHACINQPPAHNLQDPSHQQRLSTSRGHGLLTNLISNLRHLTTPTPVAAALLSTPAHQKTLLSASTQQQHLTTSTLPQGTINRNHHDCCPLPTSLTDTITHHGSARHNSCLCISTTKFPSTVTLTPPSHCSSFATRESPVARISVHTVE